MMASSRVQADTGEQISVLVRAFAPLPSTVCLSFDAQATVKDVRTSIQGKFEAMSNCEFAKLRLTTMAGRILSQNSTLGSMVGSSKDLASNRVARMPLSLELRVPMFGGKGGFGSMLRAQGGKMSSNRRGEENNDACRDLNGRRLSTVKQARQLAAYLATREEREREMSEAQQKKYAKLEKMLGRKPRGEAEFVEAATKLDEQGGMLEEDVSDDADDEESQQATSSSRASRLPSVRTPDKRNFSAAAGSKRDRIEDPEYLEQSRAIVDNVRSAVASAMLKKKRKLGNKANPASSDAQSKVEPLPSPSSAKTVQKV